MIEKTAVLTDHELQLDRTERQTRVDDWRYVLPVLAAGEVELREVRVSDAHSLVSLLTTPEITRFISAPPQTAEGFERFIVASQNMRAAGQGACFAVTLRGYDTAIGIFQIRRVSASPDEPIYMSGSVDAAEWGFAIGSPFWGAGIFEQCAALIMQFAFEYMRVHRLEARCAVKNGRGNKALLKVGAIPEGILRKAFLCGGEYLDQVLYAIVDHDWRALAERTRSSRHALVH
jgi:ribosomal-protein-alanine N-acetyltransferase